jgi:hypothetical protein
MSRSTADGRRGLDLKMNGLRRLVAVGGGAAHARSGVGGGSSELRGPTTLNLGFQHGCLLWHHGELILLTLGWWRWRLVMTISLF